MKTLNYSIVLSMVIAMPINGATCSCASVPLANNLQSGSVEANRLVYALSFERHRMNDLVSGRKEVNDETGRRRASGALLLELGYGIDSNWSISILTNYIEHSRQIGLSGDVEQTSSGMGDSLVLVKYVPQSISVFNRYEYGVGLGAKIGTGTNDKMTRLGVRHSEDMQPGSGAHGGVIWGYYGLAFSREAANTIHLSFNASFNQDNGYDYKIGDDMSLGLAWQSLINEDWRASLGLNWRESAADERLGVKLPNTGGAWLDVKPSIQYRVSDNFALRLGYTQPLSRDLNGALQFTTSQAWSIGVVGRF